MLQWQKEIYRRNHMREWSKYYQNEEFIEKSRIQIMNQDLKDLVVKWIGISSGMKVIDVGCGTGELTYYLGSVTEGVNYVGVDFDKKFIDVANSNLKYKGNLNNSFTFLQGNALSLKYDNNYFDIVVSQTFLTAIPDYISAIKEMIRVCKIGGKIASIAPARVNVPILDFGVYDRSIYKWKDRYDELYIKLVNMYQALIPYSEMYSGIDPGRIPYAFNELGLKNISVFPIGKFFSLSNSATLTDDKKRYIELDYISEIKRMEVVYGLEGAKEYMTINEFNEMKEILKRRKESLLDHLNDNNTWEWYAGCNLLVIGDIT